jgi:hypothetical protein
LSNELSSNPVHAPTDGPLPETARYQVPASVVREVLSEDELVVLDSQSHRFYSLNSTAKRVYELAAEGLLASAIAERIGAEFDVAPTECFPDVAELLADLEARGLLTRSV